MADGLVAEAEALVKDVIHPGTQDGGAGIDTAAVKVVDSFKLGFNVGNAVYLLLAPKSELVLLKRAAWFLSHEIGRLEKAE